MIPLPFTLLFCIVFYKPFLCFLSRENPLAFAEDLVWWYWVLSVLFVKLLIAPSYLNEILAGRSNLGCRFFSFIILSWMLTFKPAFSLSSFTFIERLFSSSSLLTIRVVSSAYLRLLIFLLAVLILACDASSLAFHMMYTEFELNKQGDSIQPWHTPFPIWNQSIVPCLVLTVASWPAYRFLRR